MKRCRKRWIVAVLCVNGVLHAQTQKNYSFNLANGATVLYQTYSQVDLNDPARNFGTATAFGNTIQRTMTDGTNRTWLGFQVRIERLPGAPIRFRLSMAPVNLGGDWGFFGKTAPAREIQNGDRVLLDVLEEPGTGRKIFDTFQVGVGVGMQIMPMSKTIPQVPPAGAVIHLQSPALLSGDASLGKSNSVITGASVALLVPTKGRFRFSSRPNPGFRMEAIAEGNHLMFVAGNTSYNIECSSPVLDGAGAWYLWVQFEPARDSGPAAGLPELSLQD